MARHTLTAFVGWCAMMIATGCSFSLDGAISHPSPELGVSQVLDVQLDALKMTGNTRRGIAQMYAFASPKSREMMGSFDAFATLIHTHMTPLVGHRSSRKLILEENEMRVQYQVTVVDVQGEERHYEWVLEKMPAPDCQFCWRNTYIHPMETPVKGATIEL